MRLLLLLFVLTQTSALYAKPWWSSKKEELEVVNTKLSKAEIQRKARSLYFIISRLLLPNDEAEIEKRQLGLFEMLKTEYSKMSEANQRGLAEKFKIISTIYELPTKNHEYLYELKLISKRRPNADQDLINLLREHIAEGHDMSQLDIEPILNKLWSSEKIDKIITERDLVLRRRGS